MYLNAQKIQTLFFVTYSIWRSFYDTLDLTHAFFLIYLFIYDTLDLNMLN